MNREYNIGIDIDNACKQYGIINYTIRQDGKVDVDGSVHLDNYLKMYKLPLEFGNVYDSFYCQNSSLKTLEGAPEYVGGNFWCSNNLLLNLKYSPKKVDYDFVCNDNYLTTLNGISEYIGRNLICERNYIKLITKFPNYVKGDINLSSNDIYDVKILLNSKFNNLIMDYNPIGTIIKEIKDLEHFYLINPLKGNKLSKSLYNEVRMDLELPPFDYDTLHNNIELID